MECVPSLFTSLQFGGAEYASQNIRYTEEDFESEEKKEKWDTYLNALHIQIGMVLNGDTDDIHFYEW